MRIVIDTDGHYNGTKISFNDEEKKDIRELFLTIRSGKAVKMQVVEDKDGKPFSHTLFCGDFKKYDEWNKPKGELNNDRKQHA